MKTIGLILVFFVCSSCSHFSDRESDRVPAAATFKPRHIVITVHGLSGNIDTFGSFGPATTKYLTQLNPNYDVRTVNFIYPSGRSEKTGAPEFALGPQGLGQFIKAQFADRPVTIADKISIVGHSQGGLIAYLWFFSSILNRSDDFRYVRQVDSLITLGTPFWGTKISSVLTDRRNVDVIPFIKLFAPDNFKMTRREIADLAYGSDTVATFRRLAVQMDNDPALDIELEKLPVRLVNITGVLPRNQSDIFASREAETLVSSTTKKMINLVYKLFTKSYAGNKRVESDIAVPITSSHWDFIYTMPKLITQDVTVNPDEYQDFAHFRKRTKVLFTESAHLPFDTDNTFSMAYIGKSCLEVETCDHPTYRYILEQLANCENTLQCNKAAFSDIVEKLKLVNKKEHVYFRDEIQKSLESIAIQINIKLKPGQIDAFPVKYFKQKYRGEAEYSGYDAWEFNEYSLQGKVVDLRTDARTQESVASNADYKIILGDKDEQHSVDIISRKATPEDPYDRLRIHITGRVEDSRLNHPENYVVPVEIKLPGLPKVKLNALVRPSFSTFTELDYVQ